MPITVYRSAHLPEQLNENFAMLFKKCDILVLEHSCFEYRDSIKEHYNSLSFTGTSPYSNIESFGFTEIREKLESFIINSRKQIELEKSVLSNAKIEKLSRDLSNANRLFAKGNFGEACKEELKCMRRLSEMQEIRDKSLGEQLTELQKENKEKNILVDIGAAHIFYYSLKEKGLVVRQEFPEKPSVFSLADELAKRIRFDKKYTKEAIAQSIVSSFVITHLINLGVPENEANKISRNYSEKLSYEEIQSLSTYIGKDIYRQAMPAEAIAVWFRHKGVEFKN